MTVILGFQKEKPHIKLLRVQSTLSGKTWIFDFVDPKHRLMQSVIVPSFLTVEAIEYTFEKLYDQWANYIRDRNWREGNAPVGPYVDMNEHA